MESTFFITTFSVLLMTCQQRPADTIPVSMIKDGKITFSDGSTRPLPHHLDSDYTTIYLVRHCEKMKDGTDDPDLTPEGVARAGRLALVLQDARLDEIATTQYKRTKQTAEQVQQKAGVQIVNFAVSAQDAWLNGALAQKGKRFLYVGHQNTVPYLLNKLTGKTEYQNIQDDTFDRLYIVVSRGIGDTEVLEFSY